MEGKEKDLSPRSQMLKRRKEYRKKKNEEKEQRMAEMHLSLSHRKAYLYHTEVEGFDVKELLPNISNHGQVVKRRH